jgi:hypothetical protein
MPALDRKYTCRCGKSYSVVAAEKFQKHVRQRPLPNTSIESPPADGETTELGNYLHFEKPFPLMPLTITHSDSL